MILWLRSFIFMICFYVWTIVVAVVGVPSVLIHWRATTWVQRYWSVGVLVLLKWIVNIRYEVRGRENLPDGAVVVASKHLSAWETMAFSWLLRDPAYVLKKELQYIPVFGWYMGPGGHVPIDRKSGVKALRLMRKRAEQAKIDERPVVIFPEGTRRPLNAEPDYKPGVVAFYRQLKLPVVPVALTSGLYWGRKSFIKKPGTVIVEFLPPLPPDLPKKEFMTRLQDTIEEGTNRLLAESRG